MRLSRAIALLCALWLSLESTAADNHYRAAMKAVDAHSWETALAELTASYAVNRNSTTAYFAAYSCAQILDLEGTAAWAKEALSGLPVLQQVYREDAAKLLGWAVEARPALKVRFQMSEDPQQSHNVTSGKAPPLSKSVTVPKDVEEAFVQGKSIARVNAAACAGYGTGVEAFNHMIADATSGTGSCERPPSARLPPAAESVEPAAGISPGAKDLAKLDDDWSKTAATHDGAKVASYYADDAVVYPPGAPVANGKAAAQQVWTDFLKDPSMNLSWKTTHADVQGDFGYTSGTYEALFKGPDGKPASETGKYLCVWKKQADGSWKAIHDMWNADK